MASQRVQRRLTAIEDIGAIKRLKYRYWRHLDLKQWDEPLAASDRAMARAYGPRKLRIYSTRTDIYVGKGDSASAKRTLEEAIAFAEALPEGQRSDASIKSLRQKLEKLGATAATH